jgi:transcriptional regulator with XRE-family HTH domain
MALNPARLKLARLRRGLSATALGREVDVTPRTISRWEDGDVEPQPANIEALALALQVPASFFAAPDLDFVPIEAVSFRALSKMTARQRDSATVAGAIAVGLARWIDDRFHLPAPDLPTLEGYDPERAAAVVRERWGLGQAPINNPAARPRGALGELVQRMSAGAAWYTLALPDTSSTADSSTGCCRWPASGSGALGLLRPPRGRQLRRRDRSARVPAALRHAPTGAPPAGEKALLRGRASVLPSAGPVCTAWDQERSRAPTYRCEQCLGDVTSCLPISARSAHQQVPSWPG